MKSGSDRPGRVTDRMNGSSITSDFGISMQASSWPRISSAVLSNTAITLVPANGGYVAIGAGTYVPPTAAATALTLTDDSSVATPQLTTPFPYPGGTTSAFQVCSNGSVWAAAGNSVAYAPAVATMLSNPQTAWYSWHDYNPAAAGSGQVKFEQVGKGSQGGREMTMTAQGVRSSSYYVTILGRVDQVVHRDSIAKFITIPAGRQTIPTTQIVRVELRALASATEP